ncbi:Sec-independent protein translocase protein TatB [Hyphomicrobium sp.]|jgi:sec-independent protein translocase protein TatB|uniref:Sec-independent protein translocase protein TatB n=1 Tax=Hyphomicrobium sp. TaxID=82 RepID=UPI002C067B09|nr:Sec-independent protein translocase protein TatB [Hyphomicrobium sp.]HVZ04265.1 Sec-independent protein translocase protein TatB [Hyphomicrobium sp.]
MFEISWSELLILGVVTLVFVGPKELPALMRTLGKYAGMVRRHANDFKAQFDAAMREAELDAMREEVEKMQTSINAEVMRAKTSIGDAGKLARIEPPSTANTSASEKQDPPAHAAVLKPPMPAPPGMES